MSPQIENSVKFDKKQGCSTLRVYAIYMKGSTAGEMSRHLSPQLVQKVDEGTENPARVDLERKSDDSKNECMVQLFVMNREQQ